MNPFRAGYVKIFQAVQEAAKQLREGKPEEPWLPAAAPINVKNLPKPSTGVPAGAPTPARDKEGSA